MTHKSLMLTAIFSMVAGSSMLFAQQSGWPPAAGHITMNLWPKGVPGVESAAPKPEVDVTRSSDDMTAGRPIVRLTNVSVATLTLYAASKNNTGAAASSGLSPAVVVFPGGGYTILAIDLEGTEVCDWLNAAGVHCILVKYRVPKSGPYPEFPGALQDAQRAVSLVRAHSAEWHIDPQKIGVLGFSAGGHLAAAVSTLEKRVYEDIDAADKQSCRPDFTVLVYPAYLVANGTAEIKHDIPVSAATPPAFLVQAEDDTTAPVENSIVYFLALKKATVPAELHIYAQGGHGFGLRGTTLPITAWPQLAAAWLHTIKMLPPGTP